MYPRLNKTTKYLRKYYKIKVPTHTREREVQRVVRKMKVKLLANIYSKMYPTGFALGEFYGTAKIHKLSPNDTINELPLRSLVSSIGTAAYHLLKYLAKLLSPLSESLKIQSILLKKK